MAAMRLLLTGLLLCGRGSAGAARRATTRAAAAASAPQCRTVPNTDLSVPGQGPTWPDTCPSVAACCSFCANRTDFFVFQQSGQCYCKS